MPTTITTVTDAEFDAFLDAEGDLEDVDPGVEMLYPMLEPEPPAPISLPPPPLPQPAPEPTPVPAPKPPAALEPDPTLAIRTARVAHFGNLLPPAAPMLPLYRPLGSLDPPPPEPTPAPPLLPETIAPVPEPTPTTRKAKPKAKPKPKTAAAVAAALRESRVDAVVDQPPADLLPPDQPSPAPLPTPTPTPGPTVAPPDDGLRPVVRDGIPFDDREARRAHRAELERYIADQARNQARWGESSSDEMRRLRLAPEYDELLRIRPRPVVEGDRKKGRPRKTDASGVHMTGTIRAARDIADYGTLTVHDDDVVVFTYKIPPSKGHLNRAQTMTHREYQEYRARDPSIQADPLAEPFNVVILKGLRMNDELRRKGLTMTEAKRYYNWLRLKIPTRIRAEQMLEGEDRLRALSLRRGREEIDADDARAEARRVARAEAEARAAEEAELDQWRPDSDASTGDHRHSGSNANFSIGSTGTDPSPNAPALIPAPPAPPAPSVSSRPGSSRPVAALVLPPSDSPRTTGVTEGRLMPPLRTRGMDTPPAGDPAVVVEHRPTPPGLFSSPQPARTTGVDRVMAMAAASYAGLDAVSESSSTTATPTPPIPVAPHTTGSGGGGGEAPVGDLPRDIIDVPRERQSIFADMRGAYVRAGVHGRMAQVRPPMPPPPPPQRPSESKRGDRPEDEITTADGLERELPIQDAYADHAWDILRTLPDAPDATPSERRAMARYRQLRMHGAAMHAYQELSRRGITPR